MYRKFEGELDKVTLDEIKEEFFNNYYDQGHDAKQRVIDTKEFIKNKCGLFFEKYFDNNYLVKTPSDQVMSENDSVAHFLEILSTYIISGDDEELPYEKDLFFIGN